MGLLYRVEYASLLNTLPAEAKRVLSGEPNDIVVSCTLSARRARPTSGSARRGSFPGGRAPDKLMIYWNLILHQIRAGRGNSGQVASCQTGRPGGSEGRARGRRRVGSALIMQ